MTIGTKSLKVFLSRTASHELQVKNCKKSLFDSLDIFFSRLNEWKNFQSCFYSICSKTVSGVFHYLQNVKIAEKSFKISQLLPILATCRGGGGGGAPQPDIWNVVDRIWCQNPIKKFDTSLIQKDLHVPMTSRPEIIDQNHI
jgi:hypothetical protein